MENNSKYDVTIIGGGTSGCSAAYNCAKFGLKTLLVEKNNFLGGLMTGGLVIPVMKSSTEDLNCDYYKKLVEAANKFHAQITYKDGNDGWFNPELMKIVLDDILLNSDEIKLKPQILFETTVDSIQKENGVIKSIVLNSGLLSIPIESKYFIDATGSGEFSKLCGCEFISDFKNIQQNSLRFILGNVNLEKFAQFLNLLGDSEDITNTCRIDTQSGQKLHFTTASTWDSNTNWALDKYLKDAVKKGVLQEADRAYFQLFSIAGGDGQVAFNCPRINNFKDNPYKASFELIFARKAIYRLFNFAKSYFPGFENAVITNIAAQTGVREQNRVKTRYIYKKDDLISGKRFDNPVLRANYSIDIHGAKKDASILQKTCAYELPIESLISADCENLFVAGKLVGADFEAHSALRVQKSCMSMAEGIAKFINKTINAG